MADILTKEPNLIYAGDTLKFTKSLSDYPATIWTLKYFFLKSGVQITFTASASGNNYIIEIAASTTAAWKVGTYNWIAYVSTLTERHQVGTGTVEIKPNLEALTTGYDARSHVKKVLDAIEALLEGRATADVMSYAIAGISISKMTPEELIKWRDIYKADYLRELKAEKIKQGLNITNNIYVRMP